MKTGTDSCLGGWKKRTKAAKQPQVQRSLKRPETGPEWPQRGNKASNTTNKRGTHAKWHRKKQMTKKKVSIKYGNKTKKLKLKHHTNRTDKTKISTKTWKTNTKEAQMTKKRCRMFRNILKMTAKTQSDAKEKQKAAKNMQNNYKKRTWKKNECSQTTRKQTEKRYNVDTRCKIIEHVITEIK